MYLSYTYFIENKITGQFYYGSRKHKTRKPEDDLWVHYFTSSVYVKSIVEELGKDTFVYKILNIYTDHDLCFWDEQDLIKDNISNPLCLNRQFVDRNSGKKKFSMEGRKGAFSGKTYIEMFGNETAELMKLRKSAEMTARNKLNKGIPDEERIGKNKADKKKDALSARFGNKTYEEIYGKEQAQIEKSKRGIHQRHRKGKTYEEMYGAKVAAEAKAKKSESMKKAIALKRAMASQSVQNNIISF